MTSHPSQIQYLNLYVVRGLTGQKWSDNKKDISTCSAKMSAMMNLITRLMFVGLVPTSGDTKNKVNNTILKQEGSGQTG